MPSVQPSSAIDEAKSVTVAAVPRTPSAAQAQRRREAERQWWLERLAEHNEMYAPKGDER